MRHSATAPGASRLDARFFGSGGSALPSLILIGAPTLAETQRALTIKLGRDASALVEQFLAETQAIVTPFGREHVSAFFTAFMTYGKGRHPARLNMGDCFTYATARVARLPVLYVGEDFSLTDIASA